MVLISEYSEDNKAMESQILKPFATEGQESFYLEKGQHSGTVRVIKLDGANMSDSQNPIKVENITGWEIQPYVPKPVVEGGFSQDNGLLAKLHKILKDVISQSTSYLRKQAGKNEDWTNDNGAVQAVPISYQPPVLDCANKNLAINTATLLKKPRGSTSLAGEISVSFKLPSDCDINFEEVDKILSRLPQDVDPKDSNTQNVRQFSFVERLDGWKIIRRKRSNGRFDVYYRHEKANRTFRSTVEVVNFLLYEVYPDKPKPKKAREAEAEADNSAQKSEQKKEILKRKRTSPTAEGGSSVVSKKKAARLSSEVREKHKTKTVEVKYIETMEELVDNDGYIVELINPSYGYNFYRRTSPETEEEKRKRLIVEEWLDITNRNLLNMFNGEQNVPQGQGNNEMDADEDSDVEENIFADPAPYSVAARPAQKQKNPVKPKQEENIGAAPPPDSVAAIPTQEQAFPVMAKDAAPPPPDSVAAIPTQEQAFPVMPKDAAPPPPDSVAANPTQEHENPVNQQANPVEMVPNNPAMVEANPALVQGNDIPVLMERDDGGPSSFIASYNEQCALINFIPRVDEAFEVVYFRFNDD